MALNRDRSRRLGRRAAAALLLGVAGYYALWGGEYSAFDLFRLRDEIHEQAARLADSRARADSLAHIADLLERDPATLETVARERFGMIHDGETLYRFVPVTPVDSPPAAPQKVARTP